MIYTIKLQILYWQVADELFYFGNFGSALHYAIQFMLELVRMIRQYGRRQFRREQMRMIQLWRSIRRMFMEVK